MKKLLAVAVVFVVALSAFATYRDNKAADNRETQRHREERTAGTTVYSFSGSDELLTVMNGTIILGEDEEVFSGGILQINSADYFKGVTSYNTSFYILENGVKKTIISNRLIDETGGNVIVDGDDLGKISGADVVTGYNNDSMAGLMNNLFFEINTVDADGEKKSHRLQMDITEVN